MRHDRNGEHMQYFIIDTDMGNDVDDALALALAHALHARGVLTLDAIVLSRAGHDAAAFCAAINAFYGRPDLPVGVFRDGPASAHNRFLHLYTQWPHRYDAVHAPEAADLLRQRLRALPDGSVTIVQIGFATHTAALLRDPADLALVRQKVRLLSVMAGAFVPIAGEPDFREFNVLNDIPAMQQVARDWPTPVLWNGFEIGDALRYPLPSIEHDFGWTQRHPIVEAYRAYCDPGEHRPTWDLLSVLCAACPDSEYVTPSEPGWVTVRDDGETRFRPDPAGLHRVLRHQASQSARVIEAMRLLVSQPTQQ